MATNTQTIYKSAQSYHDLHVAELLAKGWAIEKETTEYTIISKPKDEKK